MKRRILSTVTITGVTLEGVVNGDTVSVSTANLSGTLNGSNVGSYTAVTLPALTLTGGAAGNYTLTRPAGAVSTSVTISKADALTPKTGDLAVANKQAHTYTYGLGALRPDLLASMSFGSPAVIRAMYQAIGSMGFKAGNILEPSCGIGNFFGLLPEDMAESRLYGVELDSLTGRIARQLYPKARIQVAGYEDTAFPKDFFDLAVGNVPFGRYQVNDPAYNKLGFSPNMTATKRTASSFEKLRKYLEENADEWDEW